MLLRLIGLLVLCFAALPAWAGSIETGRTDPLAEPSTAELRAAERLRSARCPGQAVLFLPGGNQLCTGRPREGAFLMGLGTVELAAGIGVLLAVPPSNPEVVDNGRIVTLIAASNTFLYSSVRSTLDFQLAQRMLYVPADELPQMAAAPFDPRVLKRPAVFGGILVLGAAATALQFGLDPPTSFGGPTNVFGAQLDEGIGYPTQLGLHGLLMEHVAIGEEITFRGWIQSWAARNTTEVGGWAIGSMIFGPFHAFNALLLPEEEQLPYLLYAVPWITLTGSWLGLVYMWGDYTLTGPIAVHWWYNMIVSATAFAADPQNNLFSATIRLRW